MIWSILRVQQFHTYTRVTDKIFSFLSQDEVEKMKQEEGEKYVIEFTNSNSSMCVCVFYILLCIKLSIIYQLYHHCLEVHFN